MKGVGGSVYLTPGTKDPEVARDWFGRFEGAGLDGLVVKHLDGTYREGERAMIKVKHQRTADCVVGGFRWHKQGGVGSLLLGVFDDDGVLRRMGICSSFSAARRREFAEYLAEYQMPDPSGHPWRSRARAWPPAPMPPTAAGTPAATCRGCRCVPNWSVRWAMTTSKASGSAMAPRSSAGAPTASTSVLYLRPARDPEPLELSQVLDS